MCINAQTMLDFRQEESIHTIKNSYSQTGFPMVRGNILHFLVVWISHWVDMILQTTRYLILKHLVMIGIVYRVESDSRGMISTVPCRVRSFMIYIRILIKGGTQFQMH